MDASPSELRLTGLAGSPNSLQTRQLAIACCAPTSSLYYGIIANLLPSVALFLSAIPKGSCDLDWLVYRNLRYKTWRPYRLQLFTHDWRIVHIFLCTVEWSFGQRMSQGKYPVSFCWCWMFTWGLCAYINIFTIISCIDRLSPNLRATRSSKTHLLWSFWPSLVIPSVGLYC